MSLNLEEKITRQRLSVLELAEALSRVYLGAHYPSDVLASMALGTIWLVVIWFTHAGQ